MNNFRNSAIRIIRTTAGIRVTPPIRGLNILNSCVVLPASPSTGGKLRKTTRPLFKQLSGSKDDGYAFAPRYQEPLVTQLLRRAGANVEVCGSQATVWTTPTPLEDQNHPDTPMIRSAGQHERILVSYRPGPVQRTFLIEQLITAYSNRSVVILAKELDEVCRIGRELNRTGIPNTMFVGDSPQEVQRTRVAVCTYSAAGRDDVELHNRELVLVADAVDALGEQGSRILELVDGVRVVGFHKDNARFSPSESGRLLETYGPVKVRVPCHGYSARPVVFDFVEIVGGNKMNDDIDVVSLKQMGVWTNDLRTRRLARLGMALSTGNTVEARKLVPSGMAPLLPTYECRVLMIVANAAQGNILIGKLTSEWGIMGDGLRRDLPTAPSRQRWGAPAGTAGESMVCTLEALKWLRLSEFDVVIRLDGGCGMLPLSPASLATSNTNSLPPLLFIDCDDRFHSRLAALSRRRREEYRRAGWRRVGDPSGYEELERYLRQHPNGEEYRRLLDDVASDVRRARNIVSIGA